MNSFVLQVALLFFPGFLWERLHTNYSLKYRPEQFDVVRRAFMFGVASYAVTFLVFTSFGLNFELAALQKDTNFITPKIALETLYASIAAIVCSIVHVWSDSRRFMSRILIAAKITKHYGPEDVWDFVFSLRDPSVTYLHVRDFNKQIIYAGWVEVFSESDKLRELVLMDAIVYSFDGERLFTSPRVYISRSRDDIDLDFPGEPNSETKADDRQQEDRDSA